MKANVGKTDRIIRVISAVVLLVLLAETETSIPLNWLLLGGAVVLLGTAIMGYCPLHHLLYVSTGSQLHRQQPASHPKSVQ